MNARQLFIENPNTGRLRLTKAGIERYGFRFAKVGYQASKITTRAELKSAIDACFYHELIELASTAHGKNPDLDKIMSGLPGWD